MSEFIEVIPPRKGCIGCLFENSKIEIGRPSNFFIGLELGRPILDLKTSRLADFLTDEVNKAIADIQLILDRLKARTSISQFRDVDEFYYLQKIEELRLLSSEFEIARRRADKLDQQLRKELFAIADRWKHDSKNLFNSV